MRPSMAGKIVIYALFLAVLYTTWTHIPTRYRRLEAPRFVSSAVNAGVGWTRGAGVSGMAEKCAPRIQHGIVRDWFGH